MKWVQNFIRSAGAVLLAAALIRFVTAAGNAPALALPDPMLGIPLRFGVLLVGGIELAIALVCLFGRQTMFQTGLLAWLSTNFVVLWIGLFWMNLHPQASCIGSLTDPLHLSRGMTGFIIQLLPLGLLLGSCVALFQLWLAKMGNAAQQLMQPVTIMTGTDGAGSTVLARSLKISCTACGGHVEFPTSRLGEKIPCPHCRATITLKRAENIKMSCPACDGHIEFPTYALGQKISCPHCHMDISLKEPA